MLKKFPFYISIIAALSVIFMGLVLNMDSFQIIIRVVVVIVVFLILGNLVQFYFNKNVFIEKEKPEEVLEVSQGENNRNENLFKFSNDDDEDED